MLSLAVITVTVIVAYRLGHSAGRQQTIGLSRGTFALTLSALQSLSTNNVEEAIDVLDGQCYAHAVFLLESPRWRDGVCVKTFVPELMNYRRNHASDESKWTPTEKALEALLVEQGWKCEQTDGAVTQEPAQSAAP